MCPRPIGCVCQPSWRDGEFHRGRCHESFGDVGDLLDHWAPEGAGTRAAPPEGQHSLRGSTA